MMTRIIGLILVFIGVAGNNVVYLQDLVLGQGHISLDGWLAYTGILVSLGLVVLGCILMLWRSTKEG
jgi:hypothetical protein